MSVHTQIVQFIKENAEKDKNSLANPLEECSEYQIYRKIFKNYRNINTQRGLELTWLGFNILKSYFSVYEVIVPPEENIRAYDLLYLDKKAKLPYYIQRDSEDGSKKVITFDGQLALMLKLADGRISNLRQLEA